MIKLIDYNKKNLTITYEKLSLELLSDYLKSLKNYNLFDLIVKNSLNSNLVEDNLFVSETDYDYNYVLDTVDLPNKFLKKLDLDAKLLIHGDFRPYNIFYERTEKFYVFDWEFAQNGVIEKDLSKFYLETILLNKQFSDYILRFVFNNFLFLIISITTISYFILYFVD